MNALPTLTGSDRQIACAESIRSNFFVMAAKRNIPAELVRKFEPITNSGWWIQNRPTATSFASAVVSALSGGLISVAVKNELIARYSLL
jgi:hypothetical protein